MTLRRVEESQRVLREIAAITGSSIETVGRVIAALRDAIDELELDGHSIFAPPFSLAYPTDEVARVFAERLADADDEQVRAWQVGDARATATWLDVPLDVYRRSPVASDLSVLVIVADHLGIDDVESSAGTEVVEIVYAWFDSFDSPRTYRVSRVGLERDLERWLIDHPERLAELGYEARLLHQQLRLPDRRRPDLVFEATLPDGGSGTLVIELKAVPPYREAVDQLVGYIDAMAAMQDVRQPVRGLLIADGFSPGVQRHAAESGIDTASLTEIGYRRHLAVATVRTSVIESTRTTTRPSRSNEET